MDKIKEIMIKENKEKNIVCCKEYYKLHRIELIKRGCMRVQCALCDKVISNNNLLKHKKSKNCEKRQKIKNEILSAV